MNKFVLSSITVFLLIAGIGILAFAQESGQVDGSSSGSGSSVDPSVSTRLLGSTEQKFIDVAEKFVKQKLGEDHYNQFISFQSGESYEDCVENECTIRNEISFNYEIPFDTVGDSQLGGPLRIQVTVDNQGAIVNYVGPLKPYQFLITEEQAINIAKSNGLVKVTIARITRSHGGPEGYGIVWAVSSNDIVEYGEALKEPIYRGIYVDTDTGEIRGEYRINPLVQSPSVSGDVKLGEFIEEKEENQPPKGVIEESEDEPKQTETGFFQKLINWFRNLFI